MAKWSPDKEIKIFERLQTDEITAALMNTISKTMGL